MAVPGPSLVSMAQQFTGLPMDALIGGPLNAAAKANSAMALTQTKFMLDTCFYTPSNASTPSVSSTPSLSPIMIDMTLTRAVIDQDASPPTIQQANTTITLPLLTIIPLNSLGVDNVNITFEMEVKSSYGEDSSQSSTSTTSTSGSFSAKFGWGPISATVKGNASYDKTDSSNFSTHYQKSNSAKYTVLVHAGQLPLPKGVNTIIEAYTNAIDPITI